MPRLLKDIQINYISLVRKGANNRIVILKGKGEKPVFEKNIEIKKEIEGIMYGIVYAPDEVDAQGDFTTRDEIKKAAYNFMKSLSLLNVDKDHSYEKTDAFVCESWIVRKGDPIFPDEKEGSWAVGIKLENDDLVKAVQKGEITGISMAGVAKAEDTEEPKEKSILKELVKVLKSAFSKQSDKEGGDLVKEAKEILEKGLDEITKKISELEKKQEEIQKTLDEHTQAIKKSGQQVSIDKEDEFFEEGVI